MKKSAFVLLLCMSAASHAGLPEMMKIYQNPQLAPPVAKCQKNVHCNAFVALAKQWQAIPDSYRYHGFNIKKDAKSGDGYGLNKGFSTIKDRSNTIRDAGEAVFYDGGSKGAANERVFAQGLAVILYIEDKNGWAQ